MRIVLKNFFSALSPRKQGFESPRERHRGFCLHNHAERVDSSIPNNLAAIRKALEDAGVKFLNAGKSGGAGVRLRE
jgi:hypothetical protein